MTDQKCKIVSVELDDKSIVRRTAEVEHERKVAIADLLHFNHFEMVKPQVDGPFHLLLSVRENRLRLQVTPEGQVDKEFNIVVQIQPFRSIIRDYFIMCESYFEAIKTASMTKIEAVDMGRRGLHNEGGSLLQTLLHDEVRIDSNTARRLFTLICVLHIR